MHTKVDSPEQESIFRNGMPLLPTPEKTAHTRRLFERHRKGTLWTARNKLLGALAVLYLISPIDVLPDWVFPFIGWLDDLGVIALAVALMRREPPAPQKKPTATPHEH